MTIQEVMENCLAKILKTSVTILGCGRTDAQVHASQYFFHSDINNERDSNTYRDDLRFRLNKMLPHDIAVFDIIPVSENAHAQYDATQRTYDYFIHTYKDPFLAQASSFYQLKNLGIDKMKKAISLLKKYNDFRSLCKSPDKYKHTLCNISSAKLFSDKDGNKLRFQISSDRFLQGMIRAIVAKLLRVGTGEISLEEFENSLSTKETQQNLEFAYPQGLYLSKVAYPYLDIPARTEFSTIFQNQVDEKWLEA